MCVQPKYSHLISGHAGSPVVRLERHLLKWSELGDERASLRVTREAQLSLQMMKVYGLPLPNSKWTTTFHWGVGRRESSVL